MARKIIFFSLFLFLIFLSGVQAQNEKTAYLYLFHSETCPHCKSEIAFINEIKTKYPNLIVSEYEVTRNKENAQLFVNLSEACGTAVSGVPTTFIGDRVIIGFDNKDNKGREIENEIIKCSQEGCIDALSKLNNKNCAASELNATIVNLPLIGPMDTSRISLPLFTLIIAGFDGINPCAMWVLCFLLTLLIYAGSRKRILIIGGIFVIASGVIYFIFMTAWLNLFLYVGYVNLLRIAIAVLAVGMGILNIKDFFFFKKGISLSIPESAKSGLFRRMRGLVRQEAFPAMIIGTIVLAITANFIELLCTAGFPAIYTRVLTLQNFSNSTNYFYLILYNLIYVIPLAIIVAIFAITMGRNKFEERHGRALKLIGGLMMLLLGLILLLKPELLAFN